MRECYRGRNVRVFRLDREGVRERLRAAAVQLRTERDDVLEVRLFGSLARDDATPGSDADLLVVLRDGAGPFLDRGDSLAGYFAGVGVGRDLLVYTESELARLMTEPTLARTAMREGVRLA